MNRFFFFLCMLFPILGTLPLPALETAVVESQPAWFLPLREAIFAQVLNADEVAVIYAETVKKARESLSCRDLAIMLSRCEYLLGRAYQEDKRFDKAIACYEKGIALADEVIRTEPAAGAYEMLAANYGQSCMIRSRAWVMANGLRVEQNAKRALAINPRLAACQYMLASRWAFGPGPFGNPERGIADLTAMLSGQADLQKSDFFDAYTGIAYAYIRLKKNTDALPWLQKALTLYPTNKFALGMLEQIKDKST